MVEGMATLVETRGCPPVVVDSAEVEGVKTGGCPVPDDRPASPEVPGGGGAEVPFCALDPLADVTSWLGPFGGTWANIL